MVRWILRFLITIILVAAAITTAMQSVTNVYNHSSARQFNGDSIYNPYHGLDTLNWHKANLHAHQRYLLSFLEFGYSADELKGEYRKNGYDIIGVADHQYINPEGDIPSYEHGLNINNFHALMLGADEVSWLNYPFMALPQHQMQFQIWKLKSKARLIGVNHPSRMRFVDVEVFDHLMGYDLMEMTVELDARAWDRALSNGVYSTIVANDDTHDIDDRGEFFQRVFTVINTPTLSQDDVLSALKQGRAYGVYVSSERNTGENPHDSLPRMVDVAVVEDTIVLSFDRVADSVRFVGQDAKILASIVPSNCDVTYNVAVMDTYVRAEAFFEDGTRLWTNPFRRMGNPAREMHTVDKLWTIINSVSWGIVTLILIWTIFKVNRRKKIDYDSYYR